MFTSWMSVRRFSNGISPVGVEGPDVHDAATRDVAAAHVLHADAVGVRPLRERDAEVVELEVLDQVVV